MTPLASFSEEHRRLLERIKATVRALEADADIALFGSRARGEQTQDSDWDVLILLKGEVTSERKRRLRYALYDIEFETGMMIAATIKSHGEWLSSSLLHTTPFYTNVSREAVFY